MNAAVLEKPKSMRILNVKKPQPRNDEVILKLEGCGICGSNKSVWEGREWFNYPFEPGAPGHEGWGFIDSVGSEVANFKTGDRVAALSFHAFAEYDIANEKDLIPLPASLDNLPFPGEPLGCAMNIFNRADINKEHTVAIIGIGFLGALLTSLSKNAGAKIIAISKRDFSLQTAKAFGAHETIKMDDHWEIINKVKEITGGNMCGRTIECIGLQWPLDLAAELTQERGRLIVAGYHQDGLRQINMQLWNWKGIDVINAHERDSEVYKKGIENAVEEITSGRLNPQHLYTHFYNLKDINKAFGLFETRPAGFMKAIINC